MRKSLAILFLLFLFQSTTFGQGENFNKVFNNLKLKSDTSIQPKIKIFDITDSYSTLIEKKEFVESYMDYANRHHLESDVVFARYLMGYSYEVIQDVEEANKIYHSLARLSIKNKDYNGQLLAYTGLFNEKYNADSVQFYIDRSKEAYKKSDNKLYKGFFLNKLSIHQIETEDFNGALESLTKITSTPEFEVSTLNCIANSNIGYLYEHLDYPELAKIYYSRTKSIAEKIDNERMLNLAKLKLAHIELFRFNSPEQALQYYSEVKEFYKGSNMWQERVLYATMGFAHIKLKNQKEAFKYLETSRHMMETKKDSFFLCLPYSYFTYYYINEQQYEKAIENGEKALTIIKNKNLFDSRKLVLLDKLAEAYFAVGKVGKAYTLLSEYSMIVDRLDLKRNEIAFIEGQNELAENREKLQTAQLSNEILKKNKIIYLSLSGLLLTALIFTVFLYSNRQKLNRELKKLDKAKSDFFTNISHEFRTPLTLISGPIDKRLDGDELNDDERSEFEMIQRNSYRLLNLVDQLLDLSKLESGNLKLRVQQGNLASLLRSITASFNYSSRQKNMDYKVEIQDTDKVWFDKDAVEKIVTNLVSNAFKYSPERGTVNFKAFVVDDRLEIRIENDGKIITKEGVDTIFNRFYQSDETNDGVGIGLSLVKELVTLSHGTIHVENSDNQTILFVVKLPIAQKSFNHDEIVLEPMDSNPSMKIPQTPENENQESPINEDLPILLIVEDNADVRTFIKNEFKTAYQILEAKDGKDGVKKAIHYVPDIIISDVMMPKLTGFELSAQLKKDERTSHIPIILLTAKVEDEDQYKGLATGADDYIVKPFKIKLLRSRVKNLLDNRNKLRQRYSQELVLRPKDIVITNLDEIFLGKVKTVLDEKLTEASFSVEDFSKAVGMSRMQLHRKLKALTGLTTTEFVREQRLKLATTLIGQSDINISEIGYMVGFNDHSYFAKCFKQAYGCSPSEYLPSKKS